MGEALIRRFPPPGKIEFRQGSERNSTGKFDLLVSSTDVGQRAGPLIRMPAARSPGERARCPEREQRSSQYLRTRLTSLPCMRTLSGPKIRVS